MTLKIKTHLGSVAHKYPEQVDTKAQFVIAAVLSSADPEKVQSFISHHYPNAQVHIATSCKELMTESESSSSKSKIAVMTFDDPNSSFGSAGMYCDPEAISLRTKELIYSAELRANRAGELPSFVWMSASPGFEEQVIDAIKDYFRTPVLICGGSPADDELVGEWWVGDQDQVYEQGILVSLVYTSARIITRFSAGYQQSSQHGILTQADGRIIHTIDNRPASTVYNEWCGGTLESFLPHGNILKASTFQPIAIPCGQIGAVSYYRVVHPSVIHPDGSISTFSNASSGDSIVLLCGDEDSLIKRTSLVTRSVLQGIGENEEIQGALIIFCAGCYLAIQHRIEEVSRALSKELSGIPFLVQFTYGEQGVFPDGEVAHGNLMVSVAVFSEPKIQNRVLA